MTTDELREAVASGRIDTVVLGFCDMQGRLQGKRFTAQHFLDAVLEHGSEACNYLLAVDVEMEIFGYGLIVFAFLFGFSTIKRVYDHKDAVRATARGGNGHG